MPPSDPNQPLIFALDTSSRYTSLAVTSGDRLLAGLVFESTNTRSDRLWSQADLLFAQAETNVSSVDLFAVCTGPGGFTGIRVGMAAAKGFASAAKRPLVGVSSLEATAAAAYAGPTFAREKMVCAMLKAYRGEVYSQLFKVDQEAYPGEVNEPIISSAEAALHRVLGVQDLILAGDAALDAVDLLGHPHERTTVGHEPAAADTKSGNRSLTNTQKWIVVPPSDLLASSIARLAYKKYLNGEAQHPGEVQAHYIRASEAEIKLSLGLVGPGMGGKPADPDVAK